MNQEVFMNIDWKKRIRLVSAVALMLPLLFSCFGNKDKDGGSFAASDDPGVIGESDEFNDSGIISGYDDADDGDVINESAAADDSGTQGVLEEFLTDENTNAAADDFAEGDSEMEMTESES
jgi:hypothetical protein